ncbi:hypothetical protein FB107DRAFT_177767, partial [Schizophyllum commune]
TTCKNRFYCSSPCQSKDWKRVHKLRCSLLPVPLVLLPVHPSENLTFEVKRATIAVDYIYEIWQKVEPEKKNDAKMRDEAYVSLIGASPSSIARASVIDQALAAHTLSPPFAWSGTWQDRLMRDGTSLPEITLFAFRRLFWIDTVSRLDTPAQRKEWLDMLGNPAFTAHTVGIVPEKALARPGELSPGEYDAIEQVVTMSSL